MFFKYTYYVFQKDAESSRIRPNRQFCREDNWANLDFRFFGKFPIPFFGKFPIPFFGKFPIPFWLDENLSEKAPPPIWTDEYWKENKFCQFGLLFSLLISWSVSFAIKTHLPKYSVKSFNFITYLLIFRNWWYEEQWCCENSKGVCPLSGASTFIEVWQGGRVVLNPIYQPLCASIKTNSTSELNYYHFFSTFPPKNTQYFKVSK